jgi:hypothetical protein
MSAGIGVTHFDAGSSFSAAQPLFHDDPSPLQHSSHREVFVTGAAAIVAFSTVLAGRKAKMRAIYLWDLVRQGQFRLDLYYRVAGCIFVRLRCESAGKTPGLFSALVLDWVSPKCNTLMQTAVG